jgi:hypothetical protein
MNKQGLKGRVKPEHYKRDEGMEERRRTPRMKEENEVTITAVSEENNLPKEKIIDYYLKDISVYGAKIQTNILLPVDTLLELDLTSKGVRQQINILVKVKWVKVVIEDESYEMGVEFYPSKAIEKLENYISWKLKSNKSEFIKNKLPPIDSGDINIVITKKLPPIKNKQWIKIAIISLGTIILIVVLLKIFGSIPEFDRVLVPNIITKAKPVPEAKATPAPEAKATPAPEAKATPAPEAKATPAPEAKATPAPEAKQRTKVIGNSDSKKYHLSGMKYYNSVKAYHRVEFNSEADAIKAGYNKAPR